MPPISDAQLAAMFGCPIEKVPRAARMILITAAPRAADNGPWCVRIHRGKLVLRRPRWWLAGSKNNVAAVVQAA